VDNLNIRKKKSIQKDIGKKKGFQKISFRKNLSKNMVIFK